MVLVIFSMLGGCVFLLSFLKDILLMASKASNSNGENAKKKSSYNLTRPLSRWISWGRLSHRGLAEPEVQYARHAFDGDQVKVVAYESGKLVVQGRNRGFRGSYSRTRSDRGISSGYEK